MLCTWSNLWASSVCYETILKTLRFRQVDGNWIFIHHIKLFFSLFCTHLQWWIHNFPWGGCGPHRGAWTPEAVKFWKFCVSKWKNLDPWGKVCTGYVPRSTNDLCNLIPVNIWLFINYKGLIINNNFYQMTLPIQEIFPKPCNLFLRLFIILSSFLSKERAMMCSGKTIIIYQFSFSVLRNLHWSGGLGDLRPKTRSEAHLAWKRCWFLL